MKKLAGLLLLLLLLTVTFCGGAEEARDMTDHCRFRVCASTRKYNLMTDKKYTSYWESSKTKHPFVEITSDKPMYGLYLCFRYMPEGFVIQTGSGDNYRTLAEGDTRFYHSYYELDGVKSLRIYSTQEGNHIMGFNEVFVFGKGEVPDWVQRWEEPEEKADVLFLSTHPDDELIFFGGAIPTYDVEMGKRVAVAYLTWSNTTRRSEALNGLWTMGVRNYPVFGDFRDAYSSNAEGAYKNVTGSAGSGKKAVWKWMTELIRRFRPEVMVTQDINGEYGHGQHRMAVDAAIRCYDLAADPAQYPESAEKYGEWQIKKLYVHLYGKEEEQTVFDWDRPLASMGGKTGLELASEAYALHKTQAGASIKIRGKKQYLSVEETGKSFPNTRFGLYRSTVGPDTERNDFLENIPE